MIRNIRTRPSACASTVLAAMSLAVSPAAWSLGLGDARVESYLNQPLKARIDLVSQASDDLTTVTARLASAADYELIGASRESVSVPIGFTVENIGGDAYIAATSSLPIGDPVLRLIVEVNWSSGRMLREYTLFLDPPTTAEPAPAPRIDQRKSAAAVSAPVAATPERPAAPVQTPPATIGGEEYGPVRNGETLWAIARDWSQGSGLTINQVMLAIQRENPRAFARDNINLLKRGAILRMPKLSDVEAISASAASREVASQTAEFKSRRAAPNAASTETPLIADASAAMAEAQPAPVTEDAGAAAETVEAAAEAGQEPGAEAAAAADVAAEQAAEQAAAPVEAQDQLELIPPSTEGELDSTYGFEETDETAGAELNVQALRENLARTEEELINQQQQNTYLEDRIRELESQLESAAKSGAADADLANMQDRLRDQRQVAAADEQPEQPWYGRLTFWSIGLLVAAAAFAGWLLSRRGHAAGEAGSLRGIQSEAEDVLRVLADETRPAPVDAARAASVEATTAQTPAEAPVQAKRPAAPDADAELLDEESSDPEIQLDLARAYISMGDKEAARVILEEVVSNGSEEQQSEARKMLGAI